MNVHKYDTKPKPEPAEYPHLVLKNMPPGYKFQTADYPYSQIIHVQSGRLCLKEGPATSVLTGGWTIILFPHTAFQLFCRATGYTGIGILYASGRGLSAEEEKTAAIPPDTHLGALFKMVADEVQKAGSRTDLTIAAARFIEAAVYTRALPRLQKKFPALNTWLERARDLLARSTHEKFNLRERLSAVPVSYAHLSRSFRARNGISLKRFLTQEKIKQARAMLSDPQARITDIAYELGFSSSQHFATCFRSLEKCTPSAWRARHAMLRKPVSGPAAGK